MFIVQEDVLHADVHVAHMKEPDPVLGLLAVILSKLKMNSSKSRKEWVQVDVGAGVEVVEVQHLANVGVDGLAGKV